MSEKTIFWRIEKTKDDPARFIISNAWNQLSFMVNHLSFAALGMIILKPNVLNDYWELGTIDFEGETYYTLVSKQNNLEMDFPVEVFEDLKEILWTSEKESPH